RDEQRRRVAPENRLAERALQSDVRVARPERFAVEAAGRAGVGAQKVLDREACLQPAAEVVAALETEKARRHAAALGAPNLRGAGALKPPCRQVHQAVQLSLLGGRGGGEAKGRDGSRDQLQGTGHEGHSCRVKSAGEEDFVTARSAGR